MQLWWGSWATPLGRSGQTPPRSSGATSLLMGHTRPCLYIQARGPALGDVHRSLQLQSISATSASLSSDVCSWFMSTPQDHIGTTESSGVMLATQDNQATQYTMRQDQQSSRQGSTMDIDDMKVETEKLEGGQPVRPMLTTASEQDPDVAPDVQIRAISMCSSLHDSPRDVF